MRHDAGVKVVLAIGILVATFFASQGAAWGASTPQHHFDVTLEAVIIDSAPELRTRTADGCTQTTRPGPHLGVSLTSSRPTRVTVMRRAGRAVYLPSVIRSITEVWSGSTGWDTIRECPGKEPERFFSICSCFIRLPQPPLTALFSGTSRNTLEFSPVVSLLLGPQNNALYPSSNLHLARGAISERMLFDRRVPKVTAQGSFTVNERIDDGTHEFELTRSVRWTLTFSRNPGDLPRSPALAVL